MTLPDSTWPPPPTTPLPHKERQKGYIWATIAVQLFLCYTVLWTCLFNTVEVFLHDPQGIFIFFSWDGWAVQIFVQLCLHLPLILLCQRLRRPRTKNAMALTSAVWGSILSSVQWVIYNYQAGGYDSTCDPDTGLINWGCSISGQVIISLLIAWSVTGYLVGRIVANKNMAHQSAV